MPQTAGLGDKYGKDADGADVTHVFGLNGFYTWV